MLKYTLNNKRIYNINMKKSIIYLVFTPLSLLHASSFGQIIESIDIDTWRISFLVMFFVALLNLFLFRRSVKKNRALLDEKEEKIEFLRKINVENEQRTTRKKHKLEKKILKLEHEKEKLEAKLKDGSKNQVVSKIEEYQRQRAKQLDRAGLQKS